MKNDKIKLLKKAYSKRLKAFNKHLSKKDTGAAYFIEHLRFIRDCLIVEQSEREFAIATLTTTIAEFDAYRLAPNTELKAFHWTSFCDFLKLSTEEWLALNDSI